MQYQKNLAFNKKSNMKFVLVAIVLFLGYLVAIGRAELTKQGYVYLPID